MIENLIGSTEAHNLHRLIQSEFDFSNDDESPMMKFVRIFLYK